MPQHIYTQNITERAYAAEIGDIIKHFDALAAEGTGVSHERLSEHMLARHGGDTLIVEPLDDGDFVFVSCGADIVRESGIDLAGNRLSGWAPASARVTSESFLRALASGRPVHSLHRSVTTIQVRLWELLALPTIGRDGRRRLVVFGKPLSASEELLITVLDSSPTGIIALRALRGDEGDIESMRIITANPRAEAIIGGAAGTLLDGDARATLPFLADDDVWRRCLYVIELRRDDRLETSFMVAGREVWMQMALSPLCDGLVMTLTDVSELMMANLALQSRAATLALEIGRERATRRALSHEIGEREERERELRRLADTDPLTALLNRRSLVDKAHAAMRHCDETGRDLSLLVVDIDHFKQINDTHGHGAGDAAIRAVADLLLGQMSGEDLVGRLGGEEFAIVLPNTGVTIATLIAERLRIALAATALPVTDLLDIHLTASIGVATRQAGEDFAALVTRADQALYRAKNEGRDRVRCAETRIAAAA